MPLTRYQEGIARLLAKNRAPDSYLAGGAALHIAPDSKRYSNDLDYFHDSVERVAAAFGQDRQTLGEVGYSLEVLMNQPGFVRAIVSRGGEQTKLEWAHDSAWRFLPPIRSETAGYQLHPIDLAINKILALVGRDEARDFLDTMEAHQSILPLGALVWGAAGKDPGFTPLLLSSLLQRRGRLRPEDVARLNLREVPELSTLKLLWLEALADVEVFVRSRPPSEVGCLYYSTSRQRFVGRSEEVDAKDVIPHHGCPGGRLPV